MTQDEAREKIKADYAAVLGKDVLVLECSAYNKHDRMFDLRLDPPAKMQVTKTSEGDLFHQADRNWIDPYWNLKLLEPHPQLAGYSSFWMFGTSYNLETGLLDPARVVDERKS